MKIWIKNKKYKIKQKENGWFNVYSGDRMIATVVDEENARQAIWMASGCKEYVNRMDFEEVEDEN